jgi:GTPase SAR1 family protein
MSKGRVKEVFPGGNTSLGFFSYYNYILEQAEAQRIFILKGGPGVGKSTFMKRVADEMVDRGYDAEYMHCSSDNDSLDGVVIPAIKVALIDGTAPHVVDPKNPGAVDEIVNLGEFWNEDGMRRNREEIIECNREVGRYFARAYRYIKAAAAIYEDTAVINSQALDEGKANLNSWLIVNELFTNSKPSAKEGKQRHLFASAITPGGFKNYLETVLVYKALLCFCGLI